MSINGKMNGKIMSFVPIQVSGLFGKFSYKDVVYLKSCGEFVPCHLELGKVLNDDHEYVWGFFLNDRLVDASYVVYKEFKKRRKSPPKPKKPLTVRGSETLCKTEYKRQSVRNKNGKGFAEPAENIKGKIPFTAKLSRHQ